MPKRPVFVIQNDENWNEFLIEAFEDTPSTPQIARSVQEALPLIQRGHPDVVLANSSLLSRPLIAALQMHRSSNANFRTFQLGPIPEGSLPFRFDGRFDSLPSLSDFQKGLSEHLPSPEILRILVVDDSPEIRQMFKDYFEDRNHPRFVVTTATNGLEGEREIGKSLPDVLILDVKMPECDGRTLYRRLQENGTLIPTVVFFDSVSAEEVLEIRRSGRAAFVEKGSRVSGMPEMAALIKKLAYFA